MSSDSVESEEVVVCELDGRDRVGGSMVIDGGVGVPGLASVLKVVLEATPLVPFKNAVGKNKEDDGGDDDDRADFGHLDKVTTEIINHRGVNLIAEGDRGLLGHGEDGGLEGNAIEGIVDFLLGQLKGSVETEGRMRKTVSVRKSAGNLQSVKLVLDLCHRGD